MLIVAVAAVLALLLGLGGALYALIQLFNRTLNHLSQVAADHRGVTERMLEDQARVASEALLNLRNSVGGRPPELIERELRIAERRLEMEGQRLESQTDIEQRKQTMREQQAKAIELMQSHGAPLPADPEAY